MTCQNIDLNTTTPRYENIRVKYKACIRQFVPGQGGSLLNTTRVRLACLTHFGDVNVVVRTISCSPSVLGAECRSRRMCKVVINYVWVKFSFLVSKEDFEYVRISMILF